MLMKVVHVLNHGITDQDLVHTLPFKNSTGKVSYRFALFAPCRYSLVPFWYCVHSTVTPDDAGFQFIGVMRIC